MEVVTKGGVIIRLPLIKNYTDYRKFLSDYYLYKKSLRSGFSFRRFSALCGFKSPNYLQLLMKAHRNLSDELAENVATVIGLRTFEKDYFVSLVRQENASTDEELKLAQKDSLIAIKKMISKQISNEQNKIFTKWYHLLVRELVVFDSFEPSGDYISEMLGDMITIKEAEESWALLHHAGFVTQLENGKWVQRDPVLDSGDGAFQSILINKYHSQNLQIWQRILDSSPSNTCELGLLNIPINKEKVPELRNKIRQFQDEIIGWLQSERNPTELVQVGVYMFKFK